MPIAIDKTAFDRPYDPISSQGMMRHAIDTEAKLNDMLNGDEPFGRMLFTAPTELAITGGVLAATSLLVHTVAAQSGTTDDLDTIPAANNTYLYLKAKTGHSIAVKHGTGNISSSGGIDVALTGNRIIKLYCQGGQWGIVGTNRPKNNMTATTDPRATDDSQAGYAVGSIWMNTTLDRIWECIDSSSAAAIWLPLNDWTNGFTIRAAGASAVGIGSGASIGGSPSSSNGNDSVNTWVQVSTTTTFNFNAGGGVPWVRPAYSPVYESYYKTGADLTSQRIWLGMFANTPPDADTLTVLGIAFRYSSVAGDAGWRPVLYDGTTQTTGAAIGTIAANTIYRMRICVDNANSRVYFSVNNVESMLNTNYPAATTDMAVIDSFIAQGGASRGLSMSKIEVRW